MIEDLLLRATRTAFKKPNPSVPPIVAMFERLGIPDSEIARALDIKLPTVSEWRHGRRPIPFERQAQLLAYLHTLVPKFRELREHMKDRDPVGSAYLRECIKAIDALVKHETRARPELAEAIENISKELLRQVRKFKSVDELVAEVQGQKKPRS
jgi:transcriptional regulator with XRE-family HTH domain